MNPRWHPTVRTSGRGNGLSVAARFSEFFPQNNIHSRNASRRTRQIAVRSLTCSRHHDRTGFSGGTTGCPEFPDFLISQHVAGSDVGVHFFGDVLGETGSSLYCMYKRALPGCSSTKHRLNVHSQSLPLPGLRHIDRATVTSPSVDSSHHGTLDAFT